jgi:hypothetical protein
MEQGEQTSALPGRSQAAFEVQVLEPDVEIVDPVLLRGREARALTDLVTGVTKTGWRLGRRAREQTYRLVPPPELAAGLRDGSLKWAEASGGDASTLIKSSETGRIVGQGQPKRAAGAGAPIGPVAWEALAMVSQQHYLVEISSKLSALQAGVDEVLARGDDKNLAALRRAARVAAATSAELAKGESVSGGRRRELEADAREVEQIWYELALRLDRHLTEYRKKDGKKGQAGQVADAFTQLGYATQALIQCSEVLPQFPFSDPAEQARVWREERGRVLSATRQLRAAAQELDEAHIVWSERRLEHDRAATKNPVTLTRRLVSGELWARPAQQPLDEQTVIRARQLTTPPPTAMLVRVSSDSTVEVGAEPAEADQLPPVHEKLPDETRP